ncbi:hypothetical protein DFH09DRAFT_1216762 [Mycena vulgaris]|nr:hypothetical protein DFH09DRAFT_1216762 [Mycena vulgaris]
MLEEFGARRDVMLTHGGRTCAHGAGGVLPQVHAPTRSPCLRRPTRCANDEPAPPFILLDEPRTTQDIVRTVCNAAPHTRSQHHLAAARYMHSRSRSVRSPPSRPPLLTAPADTASACRKHESQSQSESDAESRRAEDLTCVERRKVDRCTTGHAAVFVYAASRRPSARGVAVGEAEAYGPSWMILYSPSRATAKSKPCVLPAAPTARYPDGVSRGALGRNGGAQRTTLHRCTRCA